MLLSVLKTLAAGWFLMLGIGILHAHVLTAIHTVDYGTAVLLDITLGMVIWIESRETDGLG